MSVLEGLEGDVHKTLQSIQKGLNLLDERRAALHRARRPRPPVEPATTLVEDDQWDDEAEDAAAPART